MTGGLKARLVIQQQPQQARMCAMDDAERCIIEPPPIVQMVDEEGRPLVWDFNFMVYVQLLSADGTRDVSIFQSSIMPPVRTMFGTTSSSVSLLRDLSDELQAYFIFNDLSVRLEGVYRLSFTLFHLSSSENPMCGTAVSDPFTVYTADTFPGEVGSTPLAYSLASQGANILVRNLHTAKRRKGSAGDARTWHRDDLENTMDQSMA